MEGGGELDSFSTTVGDSGGIAAGGKGSPSRSISNSLSVPVARVTPSMSDDTSEAATDLVDFRSAATLGGRRAFGAGVGSIDSTTSSTTSVVTSSTGEGSKSGSAKTPLAFCQANIIGPAPNPSGPRAGSRGPSGSGSDSSDSSLLDSSLLSSVCAPRNLRGRPGLPVCSVRGRPPTRDLVVRRL